MKLELDLYKMDCFPSLGERPCFCKSNFETGLGLLACLYSMAGLENEVCVCLSGDILPESCLCFSFYTVMKIFAQR